jgi:hypothetical protein
MWNGEDDVVPKLLMTAREAVVQQGGAHEAHEPMRIAQREALLLGAVHRHLLLSLACHVVPTQVKIKLKNAELQAKKDQLRIWTGFKLPVPNSKPIHDQKFTAKVCLIFSIIVCLS